MKKQLLIAAVAATMATVSIADVSITGSGKMNYLNVDSATETSDTNTFTNELDLNITGKNGDTTVFMNIENLSANSTAALNVKTAYMASKIADVNVQIGSWYSSDSLLSDGSAGSNKFKASTTVGGVTITFEDQKDAAEALTLSGTVSGVSLKHKMTNNGAGVDTADTTVSGSISGVNAAYRSISVDGANNDEESIEISTEVSGVTFTYASVDVEGTGTTNSDGWLGTFATASAQNEISGFGIKTELAGNTIQIKSIDAKTSPTAVETSRTKFYVTRPLASGATFEAIYTDLDAATSATDSKTLDLELSVSF
jgi:hypothetical protein